MKKVLVFLLALIFVGCSDRNVITVSGEVNGKDYVDLGLPSGTYWATCNVGADKPTERGSYFAWGETSSKEEFSRETYKWCDVNLNYPTKYRYWANLDLELLEKTEGFVVQGPIDNKDVLEPEDDAATINWGASWRIPSIKEIQELIDGCTWEWTNDFNNSGMSGRIGTSKTNNNIIFFPTPDRNAWVHCGFYSSNSTYSNMDEAWRSMVLKVSDDDILGVKIDHRPRHSPHLVRAVTSVK